MKITENKKGRCTGCCAAALFAGFDRTYDFLLVAPVFLHPAEKDAKNHLTNSCNELENNQFSAIIKQFRQLHRQFETILS